MKELIIIFLSVVIVVFIIFHSIHVLIRHQWNWKCLRCLFLGHKEVLYDKEHRYNYCPYCTSQCAPWDNLYLVSFFFDDSHF